MNKNRLEAFSDGVIAIIITIMVLEIKPPEGKDLESILGLLPQLLSYLISFIFVGCYWNQHHKIFHSVKNIDTKILWANSNLLFWLSLIPVSTAWIGDSHEYYIAVMFYGGVLVMVSLSSILMRSLVLKNLSDGSKFHFFRSIPLKAWVSMLLYVLAIIIAIEVPYISCLIYGLVLIAWLFPE